MGLKYDVTTLVIVNFERVVFIIVNVGAKTDKLK